ncbi:RNA polymerase II-associated [Xylariaceae sp. FL0016]|nr:RNA polymerase II-associated [Xylariaceae sp. FL0016]
MSSASRSAEQRSVHQDFVARIRYANTLPPPPNPPKLLDIPNVGLASGQYTAPGFASRLAREQPLNIEADAELGMPLDLVGMPGIFDGDESSIQPPSQEPTIHPHDLALLRPLQTLGKPKVSNPNVSFLRHTLYISSERQKAHNDGGSLRATNPAPLKRPLKRSSPEPDKGSPAYVKRKIDQSFATAEKYLQDKSQVKHPSKRNLKVVDAWPLIPDGPESLPDAGAYVTVKFTNNPVPPSKIYDKRLLATLFRPTEPTAAEEEAQRAAAVAYERDPEHNPKPFTCASYDVYLPDTTETATRFKQRFDIENPSRDDDSLYTASKEGKPSFPLKHLRGYETVQEHELDQMNKYDEELLLAFNDDETIDQKAVHYYPVIQRNILKPQRTKRIARQIGYADEDEVDIPDWLYASIDEADERLLRFQESYKQDLFHFPPIDEGDDTGGEAGPVGDTRATRRDEDAESGADADGFEDAAQGDGEKGADEEVDAEGDEDDD